jgi:hypothetical protein
LGVVTLAEQPRQNGAVVTESSEVHIARQRGLAMLALKRTLTLPLRLTFRSLAARSTRVSTRRGPPADIRWQLPKSGLKLPTNYLSDALDDVSSTIDRPLCPEMAVIA